MLTWILDQIAVLFCLVDPDVWVAIIIGGTILSGLTGNGWFTFISAFVFSLIAFFFMSFVAWILPNWLENIVVIGLILAFWWTAK